MAAPYSTKTTWCRERPRSISTCRSVAPSQAASGRCQGRSMKSGCPSRTWIATRPAMALSYTDLARTSNPVSAPEASSAGLGREMRYSIGAVRSGPAIGFLLLACGSTPTPLVPATREAAASAEWWNGAVVYEVFVRSFLDSNGDGSGDLAGLISKLNYLNDGDPATTTDLGVDALWLMPIYPSPSYHGYDVTDYDGVDGHADQRVPQAGNPGHPRLRAEPHLHPAPVVLGLLPPRLVRLEHRQPRLDAAVVELHHLVPEWRRLVLRGVLERHAGPELENTGSARGNGRCRGPLAGSRRGRLSPRRGPLPGRGRSRTPAGSACHARGPGGMDPGRSRGKPARHGGGRGVGRYSHHRDVLRLHRDRPRWRWAAAALQLSARRVRGERRRGELGLDHRGNARLGGPDVRSRDRGRPLPHQPRPGAGRVAPRRRRGEAQAGRIHPAHAAGNADHLLRRGGRNAQRPLLRGRVQARSHGLGCDRACRVHHRHAVVAAFAGNGDGQRRFGDGRRVLAALALPAAHPGAKGLAGPLPRRDHAVVDRGCQRPFLPPDGRRRDGAGRSQPRLRHGDARPDRPGRRSE